jgi:two-component system, NtrC family, C4-dicarboxylate transport sensor histidine kinase DctB
MMSGSRRNGRPATGANPANVGRLGIGGRLGIAFGLSAMLAVCACVIGWLSYERLSLSIRQIGQDDLPSTIKAGNLALLGGAIIATAPLLSQSRTVAQVDDTDKRLRERMQAMRSTLGTTVPTQTEKAKLLIERLAGNLDAIKTETLAALTLRARNEALFREVRAMQADYVDEAEPLVDDARFLVQSLLEALERRRGETSSQAAEIRRQVRKAEAILQLSSHTNTAIGLLSRIASVETTEQLSLDNFFLAEITDLLKVQLVLLADASDTLTLRQMLQRLVEIATAEHGLPALRHQELKQRELSEALLTENRQIVGQLDGEISSLLANASARAAESGSQALSSIQLGRNLLMLIAIVAVLASLLMGIAYVRGNLIRRIRHMAEAARALAESRVPPPIEVKGTDELSDMARAMEQFRKTQNELVQSAKLAALGHLSASIAHEVNQPLSAIRSHAHNAHTFHERGDATGLKRSLAKIQDLTTRTSLIVGHLRRFARSSDLALQPVHIDEVVQTAMQLLASLVQQKGVKVNVDVPGGMIAEAEEIRLGQVLVNLISNAIDATDGLPEPVISIRSELRNNIIWLSVRDNGPGVPADVMRTLFDPFVTTKPVGQGMGLGLTISYNIMRDFGGSLRIVPSETGAHFVAELKSMGGVRAR